jgi:hypothetical protein
MTRLTSLSHWFKRAEDSASVSGCVGHCDGQADRNPKSRPAYRIVRAGRGWPELRQDADTGTDPAAGRAADCNGTHRGEGRGRPVSPGMLF